jgi:hypothetical protein
MKKMKQPQSSTVMLAAPHSFEQIRVLLKSHHLPSLKQLLTSPSHLHGPRLHFPAPLVSPSPTQIHQLVSALQVQSSLMARSDTLATTETFRCDAMQSVRSNIRNPVTPSVTDAVGDETNRRLDAMNEQLDRIVNSTERYQNGMLARLDAANDLSREQTVLFSEILRGMNQNM